MTGRCTSQRTIAWALLTTTLAAGCGSSATLERRTGPTLDGRIDRSDAERLYVTGDDGERYAVERWDVTDIHHPGKVGSIIGGITTGIGAGFLLLAPLAHDCGGRDPNDPTICWDLRSMAIGMGILHLMIGMPIWFYNAQTGSRSRAATLPSPAATLPPPPAPAPMRLRPP